MSTIIAAILFVVGVVAAVLAAYLVLERKRSWLWYTLPTLYCLIVEAVVASTGRARIDLAAIVFFSAILTAIGWITVRFELRRR